MKNPLMRFVTVSLKSNFFKAAVVVAMIAGTSNFASAQAVSTSNSVSASNEGQNNVIVNHIESTADVLVFNVKIPNASGSKFTLVIKDVDGNTLFHSSYSEKNFNKKFQLPKSENDKFTFLIKDATGNVSQTFEVNSKVRFVEEVVVKEVA